LTWTASDSDETRHYTSAVTSTRATGVNTPQAASTARNIGVPENDDWPQKVNDSATAAAASRAAAPGRRQDSAVNNRCSGGKNQNPAGVPRC
jgi:hypothetical protein